MAATEMTLSQSLEGRGAVNEMILSGLVFVYPTDTIYGIGCDATNEMSVERVRKIKNTDHPFSVIAPSKHWIAENFKFPAEYLEKLPGPYTFIARMKTKCVAKNVSFRETLGIRIPNHPFATLLQESGRPFVTTSCNLSGEKHLTAIAGMPDGIRRQVDVIIDAGPIDREPSEILDLTGGKPAKVR